MSSMIPMSTIISPIHSNIPETAQVPPIYNTIIASKSARPPIMPSNTEAAVIAPDL